MKKIGKTKTERVIAFIPVRLSSSRLPEKHFRKIGSKTVLEWLIHNLKQCQQLDEIVIATAAESANEPLKAFSRDFDVPLFWYEGNIDHVTTRLRLAAETYQADICLLISGDCPLVHGPTLDFLVEEFRKEPTADMLTMPTNSYGEHSALEGVLVSRLRAWQKADDLADKPELKEHQFPLFWKRPELFARHKVYLPDNLFIRKHRFSVDTWADLEFMNTLHDRLVANNQNFQLPEVVQLLQKEPQLFKINEHVHQRKLIDENHKVLIAVDAGGQYGYGHLMRSLELARQLTELKGWSTTFAVDHEEAERYLQQQGEKTLWTAFQRQTREGGHSTTVNISEQLPGYDLLIVDIFDQRSADPGWRQQMNSPVPVVIIDNRQPWAEEADLVISPSVTVSIFQQQSNDYNSHLHGKDYLILRREIRRQQLMKTGKNLDLLIYLHDQKQRKLLVEFANIYKLTVESIDGFTAELPHLMASAKLYISGFGISFYEALALGTLPICLPDSKSHHRDALQFYQAFGLYPLLLEPDQDMASIIMPLLQQPLEQLPECNDGTPAIVSALSNLVNVSNT